MRKANVVIIGATGLVGRIMIQVLEERSFPLNKLKLVASDKSVGQVGIPFDKNKKLLPIEALTPSIFTNYDIALFSAGADVSKKFAPIATEQSCIAIDNSSAWRMHPLVPLVVPEINEDKISSLKNTGIIANPNCSTIQLVMALEPINRLAKLKRVVVSTYQSVSGTGRDALKELELQTTNALRGAPIHSANCKVYPHQIAFNCLPHIDEFDENGYTKEELKIVNETRKILDLPKLAITATTVRVPVFFSHSESVNIETKKPISLEKIREALRTTPGICVLDDPQNNVYPLATEAFRKDEVFVGRIRKDESVRNGIALWVVADNLRKGAATNAVQIAEVLLEKYL